MIIFVAFLSGKEYLKNMHLVAVKFRWVFAWDMNKSNTARNFWWKLLVVYEKDIVAKFHRCF